ncbi:MAG: DUF5610 domain-containing protein [Chitinispirillaceae bacterium]|nr:DUF5610 domain-containing protein [Chitinispirillaceae bacterium]
MAATHGMAKTGNMRYVNISCSEISWRDKNSKDFYKNNRITGCISGDVHLQGGIMQLQPLNQPLFANPHQSNDGAAQSLINKGQRSLRSGTSTLNASLQTEYLNVQTLSMEFMSKDGDKVSLSFESIKYQKTLLNIDASGSPEDIGKVVDYIKKQYEDMKNAVLKEFIKNMGGTVGETQETEAQKKLNIPEYWNAENTSQRIVDFALQFFDAFSGAGEDFLQIIKDAIDKGFAEARDLLGDVPGPVSSLINDTYELVMQKLDNWAKETGIETAPEQEIVQAA